jgi:two-component sensor histidine kinase
MTATVSHGSGAQAARDDGQVQAAGQSVHPVQTFGVRWLLIAAVMLMVIPAWSFTAYVAWQFATTERQLIEAAGRSTSRTVASSVDFRLTSIEAAMGTLALSPALRAGDVAAFYKDAQALAQTQRVVVALASPGGEQLLNTNAPFGQPLPPTAPEARYAEAAASGTTLFSNVVFGNVTKRWLVTVTMPIVRDNRVEHILIVGLDTALHLGDVLTNVEMPAAWTIAILDGANAIAARRPYQEQFIGQPAHPEVLGVITSAVEGSGRARTRSGEPVHVYYARLKRAQWMTLVGIPEADVEGTVREAIMPVMITGLLVLLASALAALMLGRRFTDQLVSIANYASTFRGGGRVGRSAPSRVTELAELTRTLEAASDERTRYEDRLKGLLADKDLLMQEVHHRVKNSLQLVRGVLSLQARTTHEPEAKAALVAAAGRIMTVADVHQHLYQGASTAEIDLGRYVTDLAANLAASLIAPDSGRRVMVFADKTIWPSEKVTTLGLIITELVTNAIKYGEGDVTISLTIADDGGGQLLVDDQGRGFPDGFDLAQGSGLGSKLVTSLIRAEEGSITIDRSVSFGRVVLTFMASWRKQERN